VIKTAIKHLIYETCINVFFDNVKNNFALGIPFTVGKKFKVIKSCHFMHGRNVYWNVYDCTITEYQPGYGFRAAGETYWGNSPNKICNSWNGDDPGILIEFNEVLHYK